MPFKSLGLCDELVRGILATGYNAPTEIQSQAIPAAIAGRDIIGCAQTGTGKTAAFVLPILHRLGQEQTTKKRVVRALIITPTRELALQIEKSVIGYGRFTHIRAVSVYGGASMENQVQSLRRGVDIVVATPGRLLDHMGRGSIDLRSVEVLVLDEADRMFDMGFIKDVRRIISAVPSRKQTLLFSATMSSEVKSLTAGIQKSPVMIQVGREFNPVETITQAVYKVQKEQKLDLLLHVINEHNMYSVLVFSRTKHGADRISKRLEKAGIKSIAIHSGRTQGQRVRALEGFKAGKFQVMVATDIAARGIDVKGISHVINFDVPSIPEDYIHRIGRTGRAEASGDAITFVSSDEHDQLRQIQRFIGMQIGVVKCPAFAAHESHKVDEVVPSLAEGSESGGEKKAAHGARRSRPGRRRRR
ncbi:MAG: hypothetical protein A2Y07_01520 [Planctomycetes bacterium GWF2_50_10]|nr:MAG: hypothetical protein A2Y07_01520 [Planctomycetes bacterium GWF2_50_10]